MVIYAGQMTANIDFYKHEPTVSGSGEAVDADVFLKTRMAARVDNSGSVSESGQEVAQMVRSYQLRFDPEIAANATALFIRDFDGDYNVQSVQIVDVKKRYMNLKCLKRGQYFTV